MTKTQVMAAIQRLNPTANPAFLAGFSSNDLAAYLDRLGKTDPARALVELELLGSDDQAGGSVPTMVDCDS